MSPWETSVVTRRRQMQIIHRRQVESYGEPRRIHLRIAFA